MSGLFLYSHTVAIVSFLLTLKSCPLERCHFDVLHGRSQGMQYGLVVTLFLNLKENV